MTNDDLKRFYPVVNKPEQKEDFVRYEKNQGIIIKHDATLAEEAVNYRTLIKHAGGPGADLNYKGIWISGTKYYQYDLVYIDLVKTRQFYMCLNDINSSTTKPDLDTQNWSILLEVEMPRQLTNFPNAGLDYIDDIFQYIGTTNASFTNGYFYKCIEIIDSYTITAGEDTYYVLDLPGLGQTVTLYEDIELQTAVEGKVLYNLTTGYVVRQDGEEDINATYSANNSYGYTRINTQPAYSRNKVTITDDASATSGTLLQSQFNILTDSDDNYIVFAGEYYYLSSKQTSDGYLVYSNCTQDINNNISINSIIITISTLGWVKTTSTLS